jgi:hypothetical protein
MNLGLVNISRTTSTVSFFGGWFLISRKSADQVLGGVCHGSTILDRNYCEKTTQRPGPFLICFRSVGGIMNGVHLIIIMLVEDRQRAVASHRVRFLIVSSSATGPSSETALRARSARVDCVTSYIFQGKFAVRRRFGNTAS